MDESDSFELGRICERLAKSRNVVLRSVSYASLASGLAAKGAIDLTKSKHSAQGSMGLESISSRIAFAYAGVLNADPPILSEILLVEDPQRSILVQRGMPRQYDFVRVADLREREALKGLLRQSAHPGGVYRDAEVVRRISNLAGVEAYLDGLLGRQ